MAKYDNAAVEAKLIDLEGEVMDIRAEMDPETLEGVKRLDDEDVVQSIAKDVDVIDDHLENAEICESFGDFLVNLYEARMAIIGLLYRMDRIEIIGASTVKLAMENVRDTLRSMQKSVTSLENTARAYSEKVTAMQMRKAGGV